MTTVWAWRYAGTIGLAFTAARGDHPMATLWLLGGIFFFINAELDRAEAKR